MMYGHRMELFIAQLSFFGWLLLSGLTGGILYVLHVGPYMELTFAGIYEEIRQIALEEGKVSQMELDGAANLKRMHDQRRKPIRRTFPISLPRRC